MDASALHWQSFYTGIERCFLSATLAATTSLSLCRPGTGKSVVAVNLLAMGLNARYVSFRRESTITAPRKPAAMSTVPTARARTDQSLKGYKAEAIIRNTYRTLMSRGTKACWLVTCDAELNAYLNQTVKDR